MSTTYYEVCKCKYISFNKSYDKMKLHDTNDKLRIDDDMINESVNNFKSQLNEFDNKTDLMSYVSTLINHKDFINLIKKVVNPLIDECLKVKSEEIKFDEIKNVLNSLLSDSNDTNVNEMNLNDMKNLENVYKQIINVNDKITKSLIIDTYISTFKTEIIIGAIDDFINSHINLPVDIIINAESEMFNDIKFIYDHDKENLNSKNLKQEVLSGCSLGSSSMLDAIQAKEFAINPGRKGSGIQSLHHNQNHEIIDAIAINGLLYSPNVISEYSVGKLLIKLSDLNEFYIYIVHSALSVDVFDGIMPYSYNIPRYLIGKGEILSVFFRYISLLFFGYMSVYDNVDIERNYDI